MKATWERIKTCRLTYTIGAREKNNRWHAQPIKFRAMKMDLGVLLLGLGYQAIVRNTFDVGELLNGASLRGHVLAAAPAPAEPAVAGASGSSGDAPMVVKSVRESSFDIEHMRKTAINTAHFVAKSLSRASTTRVMLAVVRLGEPLEDNLNHVLKETKTQMGALVHHVAMSVYCYEDVLESTWLRWEEPQFWKELGFTRECDIMSESVMKEDKLLAELIHDFTREYIANEVLTSSFFSERPPFAFLGVLSHDPAVVRARLEYMRELWTVLQAAEQKARTDPDLRRSLDGLLWPRSQTAREWLTAAFECNFEKVPSDVKAEMTNVARGWMQNQPVETIHGYINDACRQAKHGRLGNAAKWHRAMHAGVLEDTDRAPPPATAASRAQALGQALSPCLFDGRVGDSSIGDDDLTKMMQEKTYSPGPTGYFNTTIATLAFVSAKGDPAIMKRQFLSRLALPGTLLYRTGEPVERVDYVISSCDFGVTLWNVRLYLAGGQRLVSFKTPAGQRRVPLLSTGVL